MWRTLLVFSITPCQNVSLHYSPRIFSSLLVALLSSPSPHRCSFCAVVSYPLFSTVHFRLIIRHNPFEAMNITIAILLCIGDCLLGVFLPSPFNICFLFGTHVKIIFGFLSIPLMFVVLFLSLVRLSFYTYFDSAFFKRRSLLFIIRKYFDMFPMMSDTLQSSQPTGRSPYFSSVYVCIPTVECLFVAGVSLFFPSLHVKFSVYRCLWVLFSGKCYCWTLLPVFLYLPKAVTMFFT